MDPVSIVEDTEQTRFCPQIDRQMDGRTDGRTDKVKPVYPHSNSLKRGYNEYHNSQFQVHVLSWRHDIKWKHFPLFWPFKGIHWSAVDSQRPRKGQWRGALIFSLIGAWINCCTNDRDAVDLKRHGAHYDVIEMYTSHPFLKLLELWWYPCHRGCHSDIHFCPRLGGAVGLVADQNRCNAIAVIVWGVLGSLPVRIKPNCTANFVWLFYQRVRGCSENLPTYKNPETNTYLPTYIHNICIHTCLLLISMPWHRQAIFERKGNKLSSSVECRIRTQGLRHQIVS